MKKPIHLHVRLCELSKAALSLSAAQREATSSEVVRLLLIAEGRRLAEKASEQRTDCKG